MDEIIGRKIHIQGVVQGVGFRPFVYNLALDLELKGWVRNTSAGVDIEVEGETDRLDAFIVALREKAPPLSRIDEFQVTELPSNGFTEFKIVHSAPVPGAFQPISPDVSICPDCLHELFDPEDRHYRYPFINCTNCGPRFTIIQDIPYDRPKTTMAPFEMCPDCAAEYNDPANRRFHAQPVACPACGPKVCLEIEGDVLAEKDEAIRETRRLLLEGKIVAVKGLGGFHLACDAVNAQAVRELRKRKLRVDKPFAIMMPDLTTVRKHCIVSDEESALLESRERPIVLLERDSSSPIAEEAAPGQHTLGVMLPYTPLHYLLMEQVNGFTQALVMTSGNLSEEPIATDNGEARKRLDKLADAFLMHERDIHTRCDDSVVRVLPGVTKERKTAEVPGIYPLRRSRGYAPYPIKLQSEVPPLLATGAELKNTFCITRDNYAFLSHHIGDMENYETLRAFEDGVKHFEQLFRIQPEVLAYDLHPDYLATRYALARAEQEGLPAVGIQHHHAHAAACMADNGLARDEPVIGVIFDGTGYGEDGAIWGGEFLIADYKGYKRPFHLAYVPLPGGEKAIKEPARVAMAWLHQAGLAWEEDLLPVKTLPPEELKVLKQQIEAKVNTPPTSSMGRLFDAVAALAGVRQRVNYEAQAAIEFEAMVDPDEKGVYPFEIEENTLNPAPIIGSIVKDMREDIGVGKISARFHNTIVEMVNQICKKLRNRTNINTIALSGGVWQNMVLLQRTLTSLRDENFEVLIHSKVPANDGGLALGQAAIAAYRVKY
ncbi:MAG: carbamoyltransferase HypF [Anaerolineales bacterium]